MIRRLSAALVALLAAGVVTVGTSTTAGAAVSPQVFGCADGAVADYVVPAGVTSVRVRAEGGGSGSGGVVEATVAVSPGQSLGVIAGCAGGAGHHWGGSGGVAKDGSCADGVAGGGSSAVLTGDLDEVIVEAGGSGGAGGDCAENPGGAGGSGSQTGTAGEAGPGQQPATAGRGGVRASGLGDNGRPGRGRTGAGGGGGGGGCRGGGSGQGGVNQAGAGGGGGSSCAGPLADAVSFGAGGDGRVVISPELLTATNSGSDVIDANGNGRQDIGDRIDYAVTVRNDGGVAVSGVAVDTRLGALTLPLTCALPGALVPGESLTCTTQHTLTAADVTARGFTITSVATATSAGGTVLTATASRATKLNPVPGMTLTLDAAVTDTDADGRTDRGDVVRYTATATNTGGAVLHGVAVTGGCTTPALIIGESVSCASTYVITAADMETGTVSAVANASAKTPEGKPVQAPTARAATKLTQVAELTVTAAVTRVEDTDDSGRTDRGDVLHYTVTATNTGTVKVSDVVTALPGTELTCTPETLAPDEIQTCTGTYTVSTEDADRGTVTHVASATGMSVVGPVTSAQVPVTTEIPVVATLSATVDTVMVDHNANELTDAGDELRYTVVLSNDGTVTLTDVGIEGFTCPGTPLAAGASVECTGTYTVTQADVDKNTPVTLSVTAQGTTPSGGTASTPVKAETAPSSTPELTVTTRAETDGKVVKYTVAVTNTGTVTLHNVTTMDCAPATLAPGESVNCEGTQPITQADIDRGFVMTVGTATGTTPWGEQVSAQPSTALTKLAQYASLTVANKVAVSGTTLTYTVTTTNSGNVTLTEVAATLTPAKLTCAAVTLAPGATTTCRATYTATGKITATAIATGTTPSGEKITSAPATVTVEVAAPTPAPQPRPQVNDELASTGITAVTEMIIAGVVVLALGLGLLLFSRRRRRDQ